HPGGPRGENGRRPRPYRRRPPLPERLTVPASESARPIQPSALGSPPESAASGRIVNSGLRARIGPTIEMSPRALARASSPLMPSTRNHEATMADHVSAPGGTKGRPETRKESAPTRPGTDAV